MIWYLLIFVTGVFIAYTLRERSGAVVNNRRGSFRVKRASIIKFIKMVCAILILALILHCQIGFMGVSFTGADGALDTELICGDAAALFIGIFIGALMWKRIKFRGWR